jgi:hypothetical protein
MPITHAFKPSDNVKHDIFGVGKVETVTVEISLCGESIGQGEAKYYVSFDDVGIVPVGESELKNA